MAANLKAKKRAILNAAIIDRNGEPRMKLKNEYQAANKFGDMDGLEQLTILHVLVDAVFMLDSKRNMTSREELEQLLPNKLEESYTLWQAIISEEMLTEHQLNMLYGYVLGMDGSDCVKQQVVKAIADLRELAPIEIEDVDV